MENPFDEMRHLHNVIVLNFYTSLSYSKQSATFVLFYFPLIFQNPHSDHYKLCNSSIVILVQSLKHQCYLRFSHFVQKCLSRVGEMFTMTSLCLINNSKNVDSWLD